MVRTFIIAEPGSTHDGSLTNAVRMVSLAREVGADAIKFQFYSSSKRLASRRKTGPVYEATYAQYQMPPDWLRVLSNTCAEVGIEFMCTSYLPEDIEVVAPYVQRFKVASFEAGDDEFILAHAGYARPILVSTGMMTSEQVVHASALPYVQLLHCVSAYPTPLGEVNLAVLRSDLYVGFSDHTRNRLTGALAVAAGARIIEAHFRLQTTDRKNPDYPAAHSPASFHEYIDAIRLAERMLGDGVKQPTAAEAAMQPYRVEGGTT